MTRIVRSVSWVAALVSAAVLSSPLPGSASTGSPENRSANRVTLAIIGDVPYGTAQEAKFRTLIGAVNDDEKVRRVVHVGDIKSGSTACSDERFATVSEAFATFEDPLVYTPGDNEWTDCHRINNGAYNPLERLGAIRRAFFAVPGSTLGRRQAAVFHQTPFVENVRWIESRVAFATLHVVGSNNGLAPWSNQTQPTPEQVAEVEARIAAALSWIDAAFDVAEARGLAGVVLAMQADTWDAPSLPSGYQEIVSRIATKTAAFDGEVLLLQGDSHQFVADNPLGLPNFTRIVVHGETLPFEYLRLTIDPRDPSLFSWERVAVPEP